MKLLRIYLFCYFIFTYFDDIATHQVGPTSQPTSYPTFYFTSQPTSYPSSYPTSQPTYHHPTISPLILIRTRFPSTRPSVHPVTLSSQNPSNSPSTSPSTCNPTSQPTSFPTSQPTSYPSYYPTSQPTRSVIPTTSPSMTPSRPTASPSKKPTTMPHRHPTKRPSIYSNPSISPINSNSHPLTYPPTNQLSSRLPSTFPTTYQPSSEPSLLPSSTCIPSFSPTETPSTVPPIVMKPSRRPSSTRRPNISFLPTITPVNSNSRPLTYPPIAPSSLPTSLSSSAVPISQPSSAPSNQLRDTRPNMYVPNITYYPSVTPSHVTNTPSVTPSVKPSVTDQPNTRPFTFSSLSPTASPSLDSFNINGNSQSSQSLSLNSAAIASIISVGIFCILLLCCMSYYYFRQFKADVTFPDISIINDEHAMNNDCVISLSPKSPVKLPRDSESLVRPPNCPSYDWSDLAVDPDDDNNMIGHGSFGKVIRAHLTNAKRNKGSRPPSTRDIVVKVMKTPNKNHKKLALKDYDLELKNAIKEVKIHLDVQNKIINKSCIVKVLGIVDGELTNDWSNTLNSRKAVGIVMHYEQGGSLGSIIHQGEGVQVELVNKLRILWKIALGLAELHKQGISHGDIKPDNILLSSKDLTQTEVRLADFGLAEIHERGFLGEISLSETKTDRGTPIYCAPEQLYDPFRVLEPGSFYAYKKPSDKTDMYSFSILVWEVLSEGKPFHDISTAAELAIAIHQGNRPSLDQLPLECTLAMRNMIERCWDVDTRKRKSAMDFATVLRQSHDELVNMEYDVYLTCRYDRKREILINHIRNRLMDHGFKVAVAYEPGFVPSGARGSSAGFCCRGCSGRKFCSDKYPSNRSDIGSSLMSPKSLTTASMSPCSPLPSTVLWGLNAADDDVNCSPRADSMFSSTRGYKLQCVVCGDDSFTPSDAEEARVMESRADKISQLTRSKLILLCLDEGYQTDQECLYELQSNRKLTLPRPVIPLLLESPNENFPDGEIRVHCQLGNRKSKVFDISTHLLDLSQSQSLYTETEYNMLSTHSSLRLTPHTPLTLTRGAASTDTVNDNNSRALAINSDSSERLSTGSKLLLINDEFRLSGISSSSSSLQCVTSSLNEEINRLIGYIKLRINDV